MNDPRNMNNTDDLFEQRMELTVKGYDLGKFEAGIDVEPGKPPTQVEDLIAYLKEWDHGITSFEAYSELGITQLTARISEARKKGHEFTRTWEKRHARNGRPIKVKRYRLVR